LIDGVLLMDGHVALGIPSLVLSGSAFDGEALRPRLDDARGWLRKDATAEELFAAIGRVLGAESPRARLRRGALIAVVAATAAAVFLALGMLVARVAG
jgi:hypothetical protein